MLPPTYLGFRVRVNIPLVASASVGYERSDVCADAPKNTVRAITIPRPTTNAIVPTTILPCSLTFRSLDPVAASIDAERAVPKGIYC
jgi:hypothetical protein